MSEETGRYTLIKPIVKKFAVSGGTEREETITEVVVREPLAGDMRVTDGAKGDAAAAIALLARLTGLEVRDIDRMGMADFVALSAKVEAFMPPGLLTGQTA